MATVCFSLLLLLSASGKALVVAQKAQGHVLGANEHAQHGVRLPRGLLDGLVGAVLSPVLGTGGDDCSSARGDTVNIGASLPLGISAGISGSSANAHSREGCGATAGSSSGGVDGGSGSAASAGANGYGGTSSQTGQGYGIQDGKGLSGQGQHSITSGRETIPNGSAGSGGGWEGQSGSHAVSSSSGQSTNSLTINGPVNGNGFSSSGGFVEGTPVLGEAASVSESSSQSGSVSAVKGGSVAGGYGLGNFGHAFSGYPGGNVHRPDGYGVSSSNTGGDGQGIRRSGINQSGVSGLTGGVVSSSSSTSSAGSYVGVRPGAVHSSSRSAANSSSHSSSFGIGA